MAGWLQQPGYPVVDASVVDGHLQLSQKQFFIGANTPQGRLWQIPLKANFDAPKLLTTTTLDLGNYADLRAKAGHALRLNDGNESHFIVEYDDTLMADLLKDVASLDPITQMQILQDLRLLSEGQQLTYAAVVPLLKQFANSRSNLVNMSLYSLAGNLKKNSRRQTLMQNRRCKPCMVNYPRQTSKH